MVALQHKEQKISHCASITLLPKIDSHYPPKGWSSLSFSWWCWV